MRIRFWGVRGELPATGSECLGTGGNTPCVEIRDGRNGLLVLDAGIGLYWLGRALLAGPHGRGRGKATLLLSHTHWDHIQGFPFFVPAFIPGNEVTVFGAGGAAQIEYLLEGQLNPTYSPLASLTNLGATVSAGQLEPGKVLEVGTLRVRHTILRSGADRVIAYRIEDGAKSLCYAPRAPFNPSGPDPALVELARGADLLVHEAFYTAHELEQGGSSLAGRGGPATLGHGTFEQGTDTARAAGARQLLYFYHHPDRSDAALDEVLARERKRAPGLVIDAAREGSQLEV